jgi:hypothetical protein
MSPRHIVNNHRRFAFVRFDHNCLLNFYMFSGVISMPSQMKGFLWGIGIYTSPRGLRLIHGQFAPCLQNGLYPVWQEM